MDVGDYLRGSVALSLGLLPWIPASRRLARRFVPEWNGPEAALAASLVGMTAVIVMTELLGLVHGFRRWPFAIVSAALAAVAAAVGTPPPAARTSPWAVPRDRQARIMLGCVVVCVMATSASVIGRDSAVLQTGPLDTDSIHYHLTQAAHIVQSHSATRQHHTSSSDGPGYYPYDAEVLDAVAMLGPQPDIATFGLNLLFGWLALLACWVIGARWSAGPPALAAGAAVMSLPIVSQASTGPGLNDLPSMAFVLAAVACLAVAGVPRVAKPRERWIPEIAIAGLALGLAAGTKLSTLPMAVFIALAVVLVSSGDRGRTMLALFAPAFLAGGFWYVRNWATVGSPLPDLNLTVGGHGFHLVPYPEVKPYAFTVAHYLDNPSVIRHWFAPGLRAVWTDLWPLLILLSVAGVLLAVFTEKAMFRRLLGIAVVLGFVAYAVTPTTAIGKEGAPVLFATNTRYVLPVLVVALVLVASASVLHRFVAALTVLFTAMVIVLLALENLPQEVRYGVGVAGAFVLATVAAWRIASRSAPSLRRAWSALVIGLVVVSVAAGAVVQRSYLHHRYTGSADLERLFAVVGGYEHQRIGVAGHSFQYGFFGPRFQNTVNYVGVTASSHSFSLPSSCPELVTLLTRLGDDYVVVEPLAVENTERIDRWMSGLSGVRVVFANPAGTVYKMPREMSTQGCQSDSSGGTE
ncbi:MAG TPA: hypothetical protein VHD81_12575 [Mycobacteriales bacterium]|nr:hypothetical protein [Mycobacteriales bacterium]